MDLGVVISSFYGKVQNISIQEESRIYEWEPLFVIKTDGGGIETIHTDLSGKVESLEVQVGDNVIPGMVLAYIKEDLFVTGSD